MYPRPLRSVDGFGCLVVEDLASHSGSQGLKHRVKSARTPYKLKTAVGQERRQWRHRPFEEFETETDWKEFCNASNPLPIKITLFSWGPPPLPTYKCTGHGVSRPVSAFHLPAENLCPVQLWGNKLRLLGFVRNRQRPGLAVLERHLLSRKHAANV